MSYCWTSEKGIKHVHRIVKWLPRFDINVNECPRVESATMQKLELLWAVN